MTNILLYAITVFVWGTSWIAITFQVGFVPEQLSIAYRFFLAAAIMFVWCLISGKKFRFTVRDHAPIALQGLLLFCTNFYLLYLCAEYLGSGLISVIFSTLVIWNILGGAVFFRTPISLRVYLGASLGLAGICAIFWPEIRAFDLSDGKSGGLLLGIAGTVSASLGMMASAKFQKRGLPVMQTTTLGMFYGALFMLAWTFIQGESIVFEWTMPYVLSLIWLAVFASVVGFGCYLTLLGRIGPERAGYTSVMFPVVALTLSTLFEGFEWTLPSLGGVALVLLGNIFILIKPKTRED